MVSAVSLTSLAEETANTMENYVSIFPNFPQLK